jgi:hypothetical protein
METVKLPHYLIWELSGCILNRDLTIFEEKCGLHRITFGVNTMYEYEIIDSEKFLLFNLKYAEEIERLKNEIKELEKYRRY